MTPHSHNALDDVAVLDRQEILPPPLYKVVLLNDDYTTMDFVLYVLEEVFRKDADTAYQIMMQVHTQGKGVCGIYPKEIAFLKAKDVVQLAKLNDFPLKCEVEEA